MEFVLKTRCQKLCILVSLPPYAALPQLFPPSLRSSPPAISTSWTHSFSEQSHWWKLSWKPRCQKLCILVSLPPYAALPQLFPPSLRSSPPAISTSWTHSFSEQSHWWKLSWKPQCQKLCILVSLSPYAALLQLFPRLGPTVFQDNRNDNMCPEKTSQQLWQNRNNSSALSSPQAISTAWMLSRSLPAKLSASYLHGFLSVQHAVSLPPSEALRKLFARFPIRPACCLAPSQRSFP